MLRHPPEGNPLQITQKQWRIANGRQAAAHVRHDENKENDVVRGDAVLVHPQPRPDQEHGRAGRAQNICQDGADQQKNHIDQRRRLAFDIDVDAAGNHKQRADQQDETGVIVRHVQHAVRRPQHQKVIAQGNDAETERDLGIMPGPPMRGEQRRQGDGAEQQRKRQNHPRIGRHDVFTHPRSGCVGTGNQVKQKRRKATPVFRQ